MDIESINRFVISLNSKESFSALDIRFLRVDL